MCTYRPFISSVGQSLFKPHGCSVVPTIKPNMNPNTNEISIPAARAANPLFWAFFCIEINEEKKKKDRTKKSIKKTKKKFIKVEIFEVVLIKCEIH